MLPVNFFHRTAIGACAPQAPQLLFGIAPKSNQKTLVKIGRPALWRRRGWILTSRVAAQPLILLGLLMLQLLAT